MPPAATGSSASGRDRMLGIRPGGYFTSFCVLQRIRGSCGGRGTQKRRGNSWTALLASPGFAVLIPTHRHADVASELINELPHLAGNLFHDAHTAILMREHGIRQICTRDTDFNQFTFLEIIDPLRL